MINNRFFKLVCVAFSAVGLMNQSGFSAEPGGEAEVQKAVDGFYSALNALFKGEVAPMEKVWSHADDTTYMGPTGGRQTGWEDIRHIWKVQADKKLGGEIKNIRSNLFVGDRIAVAQGVEKGFNVVDGKRQDVSIRSTSVFRKENGAWKMISHHTDLLPFLEQ